MGKNKKELMVIEHYRKVFKEEIEWNMELNGHNFEETQFVLENALDLALNDERNEIYK